MNLALNNLQGLIYHKTQTNKQTDFARYVLLGSGNEYNRDYKILKYVTFQNNLEILIKKHKEKGHRTTAD